jgi:hypothetical protein
MHVALVHRLPACWSSGCGAELNTPKSGCSTACAHHEAPAHLPRLFKPPLAPLERMVNGPFFPVLGTDVSSVREREVKPPPDPTNTNNPHFCSGWLDGWIGGGLAGRLGGWLTRRRCGRARGRLPKRRYTLCNARAILYSPQRWLTRPRSFKCCSMCPLSSRSVALWRRLVRALHLLHVCMWVGVAPVDACYTCSLCVRPEGGGRGGVNTLGGRFKPQWPRPTPNLDQWWFPVQATTTLAIALGGGGGWVGKVCRRLCLVTPFRANIRVLDVSAGRPSAINHTPWQVYRRALATIGSYSEWMVRALL